MATPWYEDKVTQPFKWTPQDPLAHSGIDLGMAIGTPVTALLPGRVISLGQQPWGWQVNLQHEWPSLGQIVVSYLHGSRVPPLLKVNQTVKPGQIVMYSGEPPDPGGVQPPPYGSGPHLHFEVSRGTQPPYMGHTGPSNPVDGTFLLEAAQGGDLGNVSTSSLAAGYSTATGALAVVSIEPFGPAFGSVCRKLDGFGSLQPIPGLDISGGSIGLGGVQSPSTNVGDVLGAFTQNISGFLYRAVIVIFGLAIISLCLTNILRPQQPQGADLPQGGGGSGGGGGLAPVSLGSGSGATGAAAEAGGGLAEAAAPLAAVA